MTTQDALVLDLFRLNLEFICQLPLEQKSDAVVKLKNTVQSAIEKEEALLNLQSIAEMYRQN